MRKFLVGLVVVEAAALLAIAGVVFFFGLEKLARPAPRVPVFRPALYQAAIGDMVRYEKRVKTPEGYRVTGYLEYKVVRAVEYKGSNLGREFVMRIEDQDLSGRKRSRLMRIRPRSPLHGWLPPRIEEDDDYPTGARPVVKSVRTAKVPFRRGEVEGFLVEAVIPRDSLTEVAERYWMTPRVAVFGIARWERGDEDLVLLRSEKPGR